MWAFLPQGSAGLKINAFVWQALTHHYTIMAQTPVGVVLSGHQTFPGYPVLANATQLDDLSVPLSRLAVDI
ncbi:hypothetical protein CO251_10985 [Sulfobacillus sp. hq2]|nr:hypothetical protein CO251_10985 [Sulfobacillus sp. hq2]